MLVPNSPPPPFSLEHPITFKLDDRDVESQAVPVVLVMSNSTAAPPMCFFTGKKLNGRVKGKNYTKSEIWLICWSASKYKEMILTK